MAPPFLTLASDITTVVKMVRDYNIIIQDKGTIKDSQVVDYLNRHAFPRIRGRLLTATDSNNAHVFYTDVSKLADPVVAAAADALVFQVMTDSIVKDYVWRIGAQLAASWCINMLVGQLPEQQAIAKAYEKQAMDDLKELVTSPELVSAAAQAKAKLETQSEAVPRIFLALDTDPTTYNAGDNTAKTYTGAQEAGTARLWLGPWSLSTPIAIGDTPPIIMNNLLSALRAFQAAPIPGMNYNIVIGPNEGAPTTQGRQITFTPVLGPAVLVLPSVQTNVGWISFHAFQHDPNVDGLFVTLELLNASGQLGVNGLVYGVGDLPSYTALSNKGPYSVFIDISQGKGTTGTSTTANQLISDLSDTLYFNVPNNGGILTNDGVVRYQVQNLAAAPRTQAPMPVDVPVTAGMTALDIVLAIARSIEVTGTYHRVLSAVRSPTTIAIAGTPITAPGLRIVPYRPNDEESKIVFDVLSVPSEVEFGVVPQSLAAPVGAFDSKPKSLVLDARFITRSGGPITTPLSTTTGSVRLAAPKLSDRLTQAFTDVNHINRMI